MRNQQKLPVGPVGLSQGCVSPSRRIGPIRPTGVPRGARPRQVGQSSPVVEPSGIVSASGKGSVEDKNRKDQQELPTGPSVVLTSKVSYCTGT